MNEMLTAKDMQDLLQVDRSTIYRMAESGQLPAVKIGKQWRFPVDMVERWLKDQAAVSSSGPGTHSRDVRLARRGDFAPEEDFAPGGDFAPRGDFASMLPLDCVQLIQDAFAEALGVMLVVTDLEGQPITRASNPSPVYQLLAETGNGHAICHEKWRELGQVPALEPRFMPGFGGLLCARALVRMRNELKAMVIVFGLAPADWPPPPELTQQLAQELEIEPGRLGSAFESAFVLTPDEQKIVLVTIQRIADILAHIGGERISLLSRLANIAKLSTV